MPNMSETASSNADGKTLEPSDGNFQPVVDQTGAVPEDSSPEENPGPEIGPSGSDQESNVTGRSKPASDRVAQLDGDNISSG